MPDSGELRVEVLRIANLRVGSPLPYLTMPLESLTRRPANDEFFREEGTLSRLFRRLIGEEGQFWEGPWTFRFRV